MAGRLERKRGGGTHIKQHAAPQYTPSPTQLTTAVLTHPATGTGLRPEAGRGEATQAMAEGSFQHGAKPAAVVGATAANIWRSK